MRKLLSFHVTSVDGYYEGSGRPSTGRSWTRSSDRMFGEDNGVVTGLILID